MLDTESNAGRYGAMLFSLVIVRPADIVSMRPRDMARQRGVLAGHDLRWDGL